MIEVVTGPSPRRVAVRTGQKPADTSRAFNATAQVGAPRVGDSRRIAAVPLLDHPHPVVNVPGLAADNPAVGRVPSVFDPLSEATEPVVDEVGFRRVRISVR